MGAVISGPTTRGSFVSLGISSPTNLSTLLLPLGSALIDTTLCLNILSDILFLEVLHYFYLHLQKIMSQNIILSAVLTAAVCRQVKSVKLPHYENFGHLDKHCLLITQMEMHIMLFQ